MGTFFDNVCDWVVYDVYYLDMIGDPSPNLTHRWDCFKQFWGSKTTPIKSSTTIVKSRVLGSGGSKMVPKRATKVVLFYNQSIAKAV